jgi:hypothetical protein
MAEPTAQRLRVTFTTTRADTGRFVIACEPFAAESAPVIRAATRARVTPPSQRVTPLKQKPSFGGASRTPPSLPGCSRSNARKASPKHKRSTWRSN